MPSPSPASVDAPRVVVIGGGATGCGVARDLALRGCSVTLIEYGDLGSGTSSRFHGMLQSGARYAVSDPSYAAECMRERRTIARIAPSTVEETGGLFVSLPEDPADFAEAFRHGCRAAEIPAEALDPDAVMAEETSISRNVRQAFAVPDATVHAWRLVNLLADDLRRRGGSVLTRSQVSGFEIAAGHVTAVRYAARNGSEGRLEADAVVNAAGPWSARVAALAGGRVSLQLTKGAILVLGHRLVAKAINRCRPPSSHDIMVPTGTVSLFGTTSEVVGDPDTTLVRPAEIQELLEGAAPLIPGVRALRALRAWAGVRPLVKPEHWPEGKPLPRRHAVINHGEQGIQGFFSVSGGSLTTHRSMAEDVANQVCRHLGINQPCTTATTSLEVETVAGPWRPVQGFQEVERAGEARKLLCECEAVDQAAVAELLQNGAVRHLHDVRRRLRVGFGPCQGSFCGARLAEMLAAHHPDLATEEELGRFWSERLKGAVRTTWGEQARQMLLSDVVYRGTLGLRLDQAVLPREERR